MGLRKHLLDLLDLRIDIPVEGSLEVEESGHGLAGLGGHGEFLGAV